MTYLKGKDIKTQGDCLVYCYTRRIEPIIQKLSNAMGNCLPTSGGLDISLISLPKKPMGFEKF